MTSIGSTTYGKMPKFKGEDIITGREVSSEQFDCHVLLINFWASWCHACRAEIPGLVSLQGKYRKYRFSVVGVSLDRDRKKAEKLIKEEKVNYPVIMGDRNMISAFEKAAKRRLFGIPTSYMLNRKGDIVEVVVGYRSKEDFEKKIKPFLDDKCEAKAHHKQSR